MARNDSGKRSAKTKKSGEAARHEVESFDLGTSQDDFKDAVSDVKKCLKHAVMLRDFFSASMNFVLDGADATNDVVFAYGKISDYVDELEKFIVDHAEIPSGHNAINFVNEVLVVVRRSERLCQRFTEYAAEIESVYRVRISDVDAHREKIIDVISKRIKRGREKIEAQRKRTDLNRDDVEAILSQVIALDDLENCMRHMKSDRFDLFRTHLFMIKKLI